MFIAMNRFKVHPGREAEFEQAWLRRESFLEGVEGFQQFALLRGEAAGEYISHSTWDSRAAFLDWAQSEGFRKVHANPMPGGIMAGHPRASFYETVLVERATPSGTATPISASRVIEGSNSSSVIPSLPGGAWGRTI